MDWSSILLPSNMATTSSLLNRWPRIISLNKYETLIVWQVDCTWIGPNSHNIIPSSTHQRHVSQAAELLDITSQSIYSFSLFTFSHSSPNQSHNPRGSQSWEEKNLQDAVAKPDDRLSRLWIATCPVLRSKQSLTFTHYPYTNSFLDGLARSLTSLSLFYFYCYLFACFSL